MADLRHHTKTDRQSGFQTAQQINLCNLLTIFGFRFFVVQELQSVENNISRCKNLPLNTAPNSQAVKRSTKAAPLFGATLK
jgi:hypothetical protein